MTLRYLCARINNIRKLNVILNSKLNKSGSSYWGIDIRKIIFWLLNTKRPFSVLKCEQSKNKPKKSKNTEEQLREDFEKFIEGIIGRSRKGPVSDDKKSSTYSSSKERTPPDFNEFYSKTFDIKPPNWSLISFYVITLIVAYWFMNDFPRKSHQSITWEQFKTEILGKNMLYQIEINNNHRLTIVDIQFKRHSLPILSLEIFKDDLIKTCAELNINPDTIKYSTWNIPENKEGGFTDRLTSFVWTVVGIYCLFLIVKNFVRFNRFLNQKIPKSKDGASNENESNPFSDMFPFMGKQFKAYQPIKSNVSFNDIKGCDEAKREIMEFVEFLKEPAKFEKMGARIPKGAILHGPPGTGKTMLAKAVAGEANVPFYFAAGSEFIEMIVGVGAKRIRELFSQAKRNSPCIIFIDEIDAIGSSRSNVRSHTEHDQTLNQLLCELDGFSTDTNVVVLCGTNQFKQLDSALVRAGRLDRKIYLAPPDLKGRNELFDLYLSKISIEQDNRKFYSQRLAGLTPGSTGADISSICNEGAILATKCNSSHVRLIHLEQALDRLVLGNRLSKKLSTKEKRIVSIHECGHAVVAWYLKNTLPILKVSIVPRGNALGVNQFLPLEDHLYSKDQLMDMMAAILGGRAAEELIVGSISSGAADDLQKVTQMAYQKVAVFGMDDSFGLISLASIQRKFSGAGMQGGGNDAEYGPELADKIDTRVRLAIDEAYERSKKVISEQREKLLKLSDLLYEKEVISTQEIEHILGTRPEGSATVSNVMNTTSVEL